MPPRPIIFEDHAHGRMRPLAWSRPIQDIRCGICTPRERLQKTAGEAEVLSLHRFALAAGGLQGAWAQAPDKASGEDGDLWVAGRFGPAWGVLADLLDLAGRGVPPFAWTDGHGLVAAWCRSPQAGSLGRSWGAWARADLDHPRAHRPDRRPDPWVPDLEGLGFRPAETSNGHTLFFAPSDRESGNAAELAGAWRRWLKEPHLLVDWIWDLVPATGPAVEADIGRFGSGSLVRTPFGLTPATGAPVWGGPWVFDHPTVDQGGPVMQIIGERDRVYLGEGVTAEPGVVIDAARGAVVLDRGVAIQAHCRLEGPLYVGPGSIIKAGCRIYGESSFGIGNRLAGEIGESVTGDFVNKQHDGFIGHAVLGSWINLGALTTCSDLKNNYGEVRVDLGWGAQASGRRFVGLLAADHVKTAIGTLFNTGTCVGFASNIFGGGMPPKFVDHFSWGGQADAPRYAVDRALATARTVLGRRGCRLDEVQERLFHSLGGE
ncbi:MAG: putative sugar nucleotidyl transferase [bacterium]